MAYGPHEKNLFQEELNSIKQAGIFKEERIINAPQDAEVEVEFPPGSPEKRVLNLCANNYLGLSSHPEVIAAAHEGLDRRGYGMSSVRFICGTQDIHKQLENKLTEFLGTEDTILFPSCMDANAGVFEALLGEEDIMIADRLVHASIVDGMRLAKAQRDTYKHSDMKHLEKKLQLHQDKRMRVIITPDLSGRPAGERRSISVFWVKSTLLPPRWVRRWAVLRAVAFQAEKKSWRCAGRRRDPTCFPTPSRR